MATKASIVAAIEAKGAAYSTLSVWRIGLTHDLENRKEEWITEGETTGLWSGWQADSLADAQDIENQFIKKGMKGGVGGNLDYRKTVYVYVF